MGFKTDRHENGRPAYLPQDLLKLFIYGYLNGIRSSRKLEKATKINIELMWLLKGLQPDHNTVSNFRKDNGKAIKRSEYQELIDNNKKRITKNRTYYKQRQAIVEHP